MPREPDVEAMAKAIANEKRRQIMRAYLERSDAPVSPSEIAERLGAALSNVSYHVRVLVSSQALTLVSTKSVRGATQHFYRPSEMLKELAKVSTLLEIPSQAAA